MKYILKALKQKKVMSNSKNPITGKLLPVEAKELAEETIGKAIESKSPVIEEVLIGSAKTKNPDSEMNSKMREILLKQYDSELGVIRDKLKRDSGKPAWDSSFKEYKKIMNKVNNFLDNK